MCLLRLEENLADSLMSNKSTTDSLKIKLYRPDFLTAINLKTMGLPYIGKETAVIINMILLCANSQRLNMILIYSVSAYVK